MSTPNTTRAIDVDWLANVIRSASGDHLKPLGAGALAEKIVEALGTRSAIERCKECDALSNEPCNLTSFARPACPRLRRTDSGAKK